MNQEPKKPKYITIANWDQYQCKDRHGRHIRVYIKDYCTKDSDNYAFSKLTVTQRYYTDALFRLRGRLGHNIPNDVEYISRALSILPQERHNLSAILSQLVGCLCANQTLPVGRRCATCKLLVGCQLLALTNQQVDSSNSDSNSNSDSESDTNSSKGDKKRPAEQVSGGGPAPTPDPVPDKPEPQPEPATGPRDPELVALAKKLFTEVGEPDRYATPETATAWYKLLRDRASKNPVAYVKTVLEWALASEFWFPKIRKSRKLDPCEYFIEKFETFEEQMKGEEADARRQKKPTAASSKEPQRGSYKIETTGEIA